MNVVLEDLVFFEQTPDAEEGDVSDDDYGGSLELVRVIFLEGLHNSEVGQPFFDLRDKIDICFLQKEDVNLEKVNSLDNFEDLDLLIEERFLEHLLLEVSILLGVEIELILDLEVLFDHLGLAGLSVQEPQDRLINTEVEST